MRLTFLRDLFTRAPCDFELGFLKRNALAETYHTGRARAIRVRRERESFHRSWRVAEDQAHQVGFAIDAH